MTIQFNCPNCNALIAFGDKHKGKSAKCLNCGQHFIIPSKSFETPEKLKSEEEKEKEEPLPGFYRAVFVDSWKLFSNSENATALVFVAAAVCFRFFLSHTDYSFTMGAFRVIAPTGLIIRLSAWGCLFWYYMEIIYSTAFNEEQMPDVYMGGLFGFIWNVVKSLFIFAFALVLVELPCIIFLMLSKKIGFQLPIAAHILALAGLFVFPMVILTLAIGRDIEMILRPDYILKPIVKAFWPYAIVVGLFVLAWELQLQTVQYGSLITSSKVVISLHLLANILVQAVALISMRSIGLFQRHYSCYFPW
jgi:hypothetical protein